MVLNPEAQAKAQKEIDAVVGNERLPEFSGEASLPYVGALVKEVLRWRPVLPLGKLHSLRNGVGPCLTRFFFSNSSSCLIRR